MGGGGGGRGKGGATGGPRIICSLGPPDNTVQPTIHVQLGQTSSTLVYETISMLPNTLQTHLTGLCLRVFSADSFKLGLRLEFE